MPDMRLIDANALLESAGIFEAKACARGCGKSTLHLAKAWLFCEVNKAPTIDAVPVVHGRWEDKPTGAYGRWQSWCSACGKHSGIGGIESNRHKPYCPNCGAYMRGDQS